MNPEELINFLKDNGFDYKKKRFWEQYDFQGKIKLQFRDEFYINTSSISETSQQMQKELDISELKTTNGFCLKGYYGHSRANSVDIYFVDEKKENKFTYLLNLLQNQPFYSNLQQICQ